MIFYRCDVCKMEEEARCGALHSAERALPDAWFKRTGRTHDNQSITVTVCSEKCRSEYDQIEVDVLGFPWAQAASARETPTAAYPLTDPRTAKAAKR